MSKILSDISKPAVTYGDNFKVWIDQFNAIVNELQNIEFAIDDEFVNIIGNQVITGSKTFDHSTLFKANVIISGDFNQNGLIDANVADKELNFSYGVEGNLRFIGKNGISLLSNSTANEFRFGFESADATNTLILNYATSGGTFKIANNVNLEVENSQIKFGSSTWNFPSFPSGTSYLTWNGTSLSWIANQDLAASIANEVGNTLALTNTAEILPVGTIIDIDTTKAEQWRGGNPSTGGGLVNGHLPDDNFYGWLILNGGTITAANANSPFVNLIDLLNNTTNPSPTRPFPISAQLLPNTTSGSPSTVKLIKYLPDAVATFGLTRGKGISFFETDGVTSKPGGTSTLKNGVTHIEVNADNGVFQFDNNGQLQLKPNVPRYTDNRLTTATPVNNTDATNKAYVDQLVAAGGVEGSCYDLMQSSDGLGYSDSKNSFSIVDKSGTGRVWRTSATSTLFSESVDADVTLNAISPFGTNFGKVTPLKTTFATLDQFFFTDHDDVIYGYGANTSGAIGASSRGVGEFSDYYNRFFPSNPYSGNPQARQLLPSFLPLQALWPANAVLVDKITGITGSNDSNINITIKTKDGYDNAYINNNHLSGLISYFNGSNAYTRGYYISSGRNSEGQFGNGTLSSTTVTTGPLVWGPRFDSPGRNLWYNFALTEAQKENIKTSSDALSNLLNDNTIREQIRKRFNWFKPNAITDGGLRPLAADALAEWRTQTGLSVGTNFSDYSWYIKKVVRTYDAHYVIIGKPGNEEDNEVWCAGTNRRGSFGNPLTSSSNNRDFVPMLSNSTAAFTNYYKVTGSTSTSTTGTVFERIERVNPNDSNSNPQPHGLLDFDILTFGTTNRYVILGNSSGQNRSTQFRLFSSFEGARLAFISNSNVAIVTLNSTTTSGIAQTHTRRSRLKGIVDMSVSRGTSSDSSGDGIILRKALSFKQPLSSDSLIDNIIEDDILTDDLLSCGLNTNGSLAINSTDNAVIPVVNAFEGGRVSSNKIIKLVTCNFSAISFALTSNKTLYFAGNRASGCLNSGSIASGNIVKWTNVNIANIHDFFVIDDASPLSRIFIIAETHQNSGIYDLYAGGINRNYILGTSVSLGVATPNYAKLIFPENPKNIVNIAGAMDQTYMLCKDEGDSIGRVYVTGREVGRSYFPVSTVTKTFPQFKKIDRDIL